MTQNSSKSPGAKARRKKPEKLEFVQPFIPVKDIRNGIVETTDGRYVKILEIEPINFMLRSSEEQYNILSSFASWLKISPMKLQFKSITRKADSDKHIAMIRKELSIEDNAQCKAMGEDYIRLIKDVGSREALTRRFFLIYQYEAIGRSESDDYNHIEILYGIDKAVGADLLTALGLENGADRYTNADHLDNAKYYYQSDVLIDALAQALQNNSTTVKNALETYVANNGGTAMPLTGAYGKSQANNLDLGLYIIAETKCPEMVTSTCAPFFLSIPMSPVSGSNATDGNTRWLYDVTIYPKNLTGIPTLTKSLRENVNDTGKHKGATNDVTDGYANTGTASDGDVIDYQILSTLASITSKSTYYSELAFIDTLSPGLSYNKNDILIEFFSDAACTNLLDSWDESKGYFKVSYSSTSKNESVMTIEMTAQGLNEINTNKRVYTGASMINSGYSDCTVRITYKATMHSDDSVVYGNSGNPNEVVMLWKRSSQDYYDTLVDDAHIFTYAVELVKLFSDAKGDYANVEFIMQNDSDKYYVKAELNKDEGVYYVVGHVADKKDATHFIPVKNADGEGLVIVKGLEDDAYTVTEVRTDNGYTLLKDNIKIVISQVEATELCDIYSSDLLGLVQNDPRYAAIIKDTGNLKNMPQPHLEHHLLTASATVDSKNVNMLDDDGSANAIVPLKVINTRGFDLPQTGDSGTMAFSIIGILLMACAAVVIVMVFRKKCNSN